MAQGFKISIVLLVTAIAFFLVYKLSGRILWDKMSASQAMGSVLSISSAFYDTNRLNPEGFKLLMRNLESNSPAQLELNVFKAPASHELDARVTNGQVVDGWGNRFFISRGSSGDPRDFIVISVGADGKLGTKDDVRSDRKPGQ